MPALVAPPADPAFAIGNVFGEGGAAIVTDSTGDIYLTGSFLGTVDFDPGPGTFNLVGPEPPAGPPGLPGDPAFVAKYSAAGNFVWAVALENTMGGNGIAVDAAGNVYATGQGIAQREGFADGAFLVKLDADDGSLVWRREVGNTYGTGVAVDGGGNVLVVGEFSDSSTFGSTTLTASGYNGFVTKLDASGNFLWAKAPATVVNGTGLNIGPDPEQIAVDGAGNSYIVGRYDGTADFDPGAGSANLTSIGGSDIFVWKLDASGDFVWARSMGSTGHDGSNGNGDIALDNSSNLIVAGRWSGAVQNDFDPGPGTLKLARAEPSYVVKLNSSGNLVWGRSIPVYSANGVAVDGSGNVYTTGQFSGTADFDPSKARFNLTSAGSDDIFVSKLTSAGNFADAIRMGGTVWDRGTSIALDGSNVWTSGQFNGTSDFDPGPGTDNVTSAGGSDIFVSKLTQPSALLAAGPIRVGPAGGTINSRRVEPLLAEALARWQAAGVNTTGLGRIDVRIADLGGTTLGLASGNTIWLDDNAAGWGWFVDKTPRNDSEFTRRGNQGEQKRMDLLSVLVHEVGHLLGHDHEDSGVMSATLAAGTRAMIGWNGLDWSMVLEANQTRRR